jgi:hypothetical protein
MLVRLFFFNVYSVRIEKKVRVFFHEVSGFPEKRFDRIPVLAHTADPDFGALDQMLIIYFRNRKVKSFSQAVFDAV